MDNLLDVNNEFSLFGIHFADPWATLIRLALIIIIGMILIRILLAVIRHILKKIDSDWKPEKDKTIIVGHGNCPEEAEAMKEKILTHHPEATVYIMRVGPVIGCHTGPSILAAVFYR